MSTGPQSVADGYVPHGRVAPRDVRRASTLVYVVESATEHTDLLLFNYWRHKRGLEGLRMRLSVFSLAGERVGGMEQPIDFPGARRLPMSGVLRDAGIAMPFEGSAELEILSPVNLVIQYPAVVVRYHGHDWHAATHSYTRTLAAESGDDAPDRLSRVREGTFTLSGRDGEEPFVVIHNGDRAVAQHDVVFEVCNAAGAVRRFTLPAVAYGPRETRVFRPGDLFPLREHLDGRPGCLVVETLVAGTFPRLLTGFRRRGGGMTVDHSFVTCEAERVGEDLVAGDGSQPPLARAVPLLAGHQCWLDIYPHHPRTTSKGAVRLVDAAGAELDVLPLDLSSVERMESVRIPSAVDGRMVSTAIVELSGETAVPRRFGFGVRYEAPGGVTGYVSESGIPCDSRGVQFSWMPCVLGAGYRSHVLLHNHDAGPAPVDAAYEFSLHGAHGRPPLTAQRTVPLAHTLQVAVDDLFPGAAEYLAGEWGWIIAQSPRHARTALFYAAESPGGYLAVDHAF